MAEHTHVHYTKCLIFPTFLSDVFRPSIYFLFLLIMNLITKVVLDHLFILLMAIYSIFIQQLSTHNLEM